MRARALVCYASAMDLLWAQQGGLGQRQQRQQWQAKPPEEEVQLLRLKESLLCTHLVPVIRNRWVGAKAT